MLPPSYTETGQFATQVYGFLSTFFEAFLWAGLGGAATAYAAVEERDKLTAIFSPLLWVFGFRAIQYVIQDTPFHLQDRLFEAFGGNRSEFRRRDPLYWFDSEWLEAILGTGWGGNNLRFGPDADWRVKPILKSRHHN